jgi:hypothetical protein
MADHSQMYQRRLPDASEPLGELIEEFKEETAGVPLTIGLVHGALGVLLVAARLLIDLHEFLVVLGFIWIGLGLLLSALGNSLKKNRLLVHADGLVQLKGGEAQDSLWKDVQNILVEQRRHYASGLCHSVHYYCSLQRNDGTVTKVTPSRLRLESCGSFRNVGRCLPGPDQTDAVGLFPGA